jgi:hypothetical protein
MKLNSLELEKEGGQQDKFDSNTLETEEDGLIAGQLDWQCLV